LQALQVSPFEGDQRDSIRASGDYPLPKPRPSVAKRQREQAKRDKKVMKAEKKAQRQTDGPELDDEPIVREMPITD
jgi:hypothetical protein